MLISPNYIMVYIYILKLEQGKYYIGKTNHPEFRLANHFQSNGSEWTKKYKPLEVIDIKPNCDDYDEDKVTRQYMDKYGINNVRGGSFVTIKLKKSIIDTLNQMNNGTNNKCFICGKDNHFAKDCEEDECWETESDEEEHETVWGCEKCGKEFTEEKKCVYHEKYCRGTNKEEYCSRCGRKGHYDSDCYASKHIKGYYLKKKEKEWDW